jgi:hypothetical protein
MAPPCCGQAADGYQVVWQLRNAPGQQPVLEYADQETAEREKTRHKGGIVMRVHKRKTAAR